MEFREAANKIYVVNDSGETIGTASLSFPKPDVFTIDSVVVVEAARGRGLAAKLVELSVIRAIREEKKIVPVCSYAVAQFEKRTDYQLVEAAHL
ncbi:GNAT family N-acetyltransferase [Listeria grayi]|uniref:GNAT family N-acetyltransferase n=1 Tax=Listeria grayi TaxID=1641 RepID=UPI0016271C7A|nr:GNAT family N-acetyltransferase [Listeria grayi]MBC1922023.1 N-acetyltransferase [Listeria grayi]